MTTKNLTRKVRECNPRVIITSSLGYFKDALSNPEMIAEILGLKD